MIYIYIDIRAIFNKKGFIAEVTSRALSQYIHEWHDILDSARRGEGGNKLRTYRNFKMDFMTEVYCQSFLPRNHRSALAKFRSGVAPIRLETGRYEGLPVCDRICPFCDPILNVEDEKHVLIYCKLYEDLREVLFHRARSILSDFYDLSDDDKLNFILSNHDIVRTSAKTCCLILDRRSCYLYK